MRVEFESKTVLHFDEHKAAIAGSSLAYNGAVHTVAIYAVTFANVINAHLSAQGFQCPSPIRIATYPNSAISIRAMVCISFYLANWLARACRIRCFFCSVFMRQSFAIYGHDPAAP